MFTGEGQGDCKGSRSSDCPPEADAVEGKTPCDLVLVFRGGGLKSAAADEAEPGAAAGVVGAVQMMTVGRWA